MHGVTEEKFERHPSSRVLHAFDRWASGPTLALAVVIADLGWFLYIALNNFPEHQVAIFHTVAAAVTLAMVFVIQHTQARAQEATQRKLDEIVRSSANADNTMINLEEAPDDELEEATETHRDVKRDAQNDPPT